MAGMIRIEGLDELVQGLINESAQVQSRASQAIGKTARRIEDTARKAAPKDTGDLEASIETTQSGTRAEIGPTVRYGRFMEFGTYKDAPQPFMGPAADRHGDELVTEIERLVGEL